QLDGIDTSTKAWNEQLKLADEQWRKLPEYQKTMLIDAARAYDIANAALQAKKDQAKIDQDNQNRLDNFLEEMDRKFQKHLTNSEKLDELLQQHGVTLSANDNYIAHMNALLLDSEEFWKKITEHAKEYGMVLDGPAIQEALKIKDGSKLPNGKKAGPLVPYDPAHPAPSAQPLFDEATVQNEIDEIDQAFEKGFMGMFQNISKGWKAMLQDFGTSFLQTIQKIAQTNLENLLFGTPDQQGNRTGGLLAPLLDGMDSLFGGIFGAMLPASADQTNGADPAETANTTATTTNTSTTGLNTTALSTVNTALGTVDYSLQANTIALEQLTYSLQASAGGGGGGGSGGGGLFGLLDGFFNGGDASGGADGGFQSAGDIFTGMGGSDIFGQSSDFLGAGGDFGGAFASGGDFMGGLPILVGERGPELLFPRSPGSVMSNGDLRSALSRSGTDGAAARPIQVILNVSTPDARSFMFSQDQIHAQLANGLRRASRNL
ncbi:MAG: hypothetical protein JOZ05_12240, partial [Acetobacteraceae bacterium]|nr:hypothetical protein [Acetobacteraceae bacterium]